MNKRNEYLIVNFWDTNHNYGAVLTAFAMQQLVRSFGYETKLLNTGERTTLSTYKGKFPEKFVEDFLSKTEIMNFKEAAKYTKNIRGVILGSDQILRIQYIKVAYNKYLLNFVDKSCRKFALSASFGIDLEDFINDEFSTNENLKKMKKALQSFDYLSTRELSGKDICKKVFNLNSDTILDPVFLISKDEYNRILEKSTLDCSDKIVSYVLDSNEDYLKLFDFYKEKYNCELKNLYDKKDKPSVSNWLNAIKTCKFLITDSFHGVCFALIFNKPFICIKNQDRGGARFDTLCKLFGIDKCFVTNAKEAFEREILNIDFSTINEKIELEKESCLKLVAEVLSNDYSNNQNKIELEPKQTIFNKELPGLVKDCIANKILFYIDKSKKNKYLNAIKRAKHKIEWGI